MGPGVGNKPFVFTNPGKKQNSGGEFESSSIASSSALLPAGSDSISGEIIEGVIVASSVEGNSCRLSGRTSPAPTMVDEEQPTVISAKPNQPEWHFNTSVAIAINALAHFKEDGGTKMLQCYLGHTFSLIGAETVREDFRKFLEIVAKNRTESAEEMWHSTFGKVNNPGSLTMAKNAQSITALNDYNKAQFSVRPKDMRLAFTQEKLNMVAIQSICNTMSTVQDRMEKLEAAMTKPSSNPPRAEAPVVNTFAPLVARTQPTTKEIPAMAPPRKRSMAGLLKAATPETDWKTVPSKSQSRSRAHTVTGSAGDYVGPKTDKGLKIMVGDGFTQDKVVEAVKQAAKVELNQVEIEELATSVKNYSLSYRVKIKAMRKDHAKTLLTSDFWPTGMQVTEWNRPWRPLRKQREIKVFVGNVRMSANQADVAEKIRAIYEASNVRVETALAEPFVGKKEKSENANHQNLVVTVTAVEEGINMDPIQVAKEKGSIPAGIFVRRYNQRQPLSPPEW